MRAAPAVLLVAASGLAVIACSPTPAPAPNVSLDNTSNRFLYVVNCDSRVDKLDLTRQEVVASFHLNDRAGSSSAVPASPDGKIDGCLVQRVVTDVKGEKVSLIAPKSARLDSDGLQEFQALTFVLPDWRLTATLPAGKLPEAPRLKLDANGSPQVLNDAQWTPETMWDLSMYKGQDNASGLVLESSGVAALLSLLSAKSDKLAFGLAESTARTLVNLESLPITTLRHVHLAPGGGYVLVEGTESTEKDAKTTGVVHLYNAVGEYVAERKDDSIRSMVFVALTPNGYAVYQSENRYQFIAMGRPFGALAVTKPMSELAEPGLVFSKK